MKLLITPFDVFNYNYFSSKENKQITTRFVKNLNYIYNLASNIKLKN